MTHSIKPKRNQMKFKQHPTKVANSQLRQEFENLIVDVHMEAQIWFYYRGFQKQPNSQEI